MAQPNDAIPEIRTAGEWLTRLLRADRDLLAAACEDALGEVPGALHQVRVSCRRTRSHLKAARELIPREHSDPLRDELRWLAGVCAPARDREVLRELMSDQADLLPDAVAHIDQLLGGEQHDAEKGARQAIAGPRLVELLGRLSRTPPMNSDAALPAEVVATRLVRRAWKQFGSLADALTPGSADEEWHRARIAAKHARYVAEAARPVLGPWAARRAARAKQAQSILGRHQDMVVAAQEVRRLAEHADARQLADHVGRLADTQGARRHRLRTEFLHDWAE